MKFDRLKQSRFAVLMCLIVAGEAIFSLPFHVARYFRPSFLEGFDLSNAMLGDIFAVYGITAMLAYFPGGLIADRVSARNLLVVSLFATAAGGLYLATIPSPTGMAWLFGYWGVTTILLFWAAMIRATRAWGGDSAQGRAFGFLDGGRGLVAAAGASVAVWSFAAAVGADPAVLSTAERHRGLVTVIYFYCGLTFAAGVLCWVFVPNKPPESRQRANGSRSMAAVFSNPFVWLQAAIVVCAYCGYKGLDNYGLYAVDVLEMNEVEAANFTALSAYLRPVGAIAAGLIADRVNARLSIAVLFATLVVSYGLTGFVDPSGIETLVVSNLLISYLAVFALRGIYFALLAEARVSWANTGTAVGVVSVVGYTPDIFFAPIAGRILDSAPGLAGHQHYFLFLAVIAALGLVAAAALTRLLQAPRVPALEH